jgi:hypothetical protein
MKGKLTSKEVPIKNSRSASFHVVGTGTADGNILTYSVQGFEMPIKCEWSGHVIVICISRYNKISPLVDYIHQIVARNIVLRKSHLATSRA